MWLHITINRSWTNIKYFPCCIARYSTLHQQAISDGSYVRISSGRCMGRPLRGMEAINVLEDSRPSNCSPLYDMAESIGMAESEEQIKKDYCTCRFTCTQRNTSSELIKPCFRYVMPQQLPKRSTAMDSMHDAHSCSSALESISSVSPTL